MFTYLIQEIELPALDNVLSRSIKKNIKTFQFYINKNKYMSNKIICRHT